MSMWKYYETKSISLIAYFFVCLGLSLCSCCPPKSDVLGSAKATSDLSDFNFNTLRSFPQKSQEHSAIFMTSLQASTLTLPRFHIAPISVQSAISSQIKMFDKLNDTSEKESTDHSKKSKLSPI